MCDVTSYLKKFPTNKFKISQHFVNGIATNPQDRAIVSSIITLAQNMKLKVVAEGVETKEQLIFLKQQQCDEMQGYLFSKPLPAEACGKMLVKCNKTMALKKSWLSRYRLVPGKKRVAFPL